MAGIIENGVLMTRFVAPMTVISNQPVFTADTLSLKRQTNSQGSQRWEIETRVEPSASSADFLVHAVTKGYSQIIDIQMPQVYRSAANSTTTTSTVQVNSSSIVAGNNSIAIDNNNGKIAKGEFIQFANHDKVYLVTADRSGSGNLSIYPNLVSDVPDNTVIKYGNNVVMKARYDTDVILGITYVDGILSDPGQIKLIEAL